MKLKQNKLFMMLHLSSLGKSHFTSYVQLRGSVPAFWSQDPKQVPKPPIMSKENLND